MKEFSQKDRKKMRNFHQNSLDLMECIKTNIDMGTWLILIRLLLEKYRVFKEDMVNI